MNYLHTTEAELGINLDIPLSMKEPLEKLNDLANKKRKHADDIHDYFKSTKMLKSSVQYRDHLPSIVLNEPVLGMIMFNFYHKQDFVTIEDLKDFSNAMLYTIQEIFFRRHQGHGVDDHDRTFSSLLLAEVDKRNLNPLKQMRTIEQLRQLKFKFEGDNTPIVIQPPCCFASKISWDQQKGSEVGRGVKEKHVSFADKSVKGRKHVNVVNTGIESFPTVSEAHGIQTSISNAENMNDVGTIVGPNLAGNILGMSSYANVIGASSRKALNFHTLFTPGGNGVDVVVLVESIRAISDRFANTAYGFFLGKRVAYHVAANYISSMDGLNAMLDNGPWFIRNNLLILKKWNLDVNLLKEDVANVLVLVKLQGVSVTAFSKDGLSAIATKLATPLMLAGIKRLHDDLGITGVKLMLLVYKLLLLVKS
ncbi:zinc finger, CCHC-type containing protein [Tanacetum coccineum]